MLMPRTIIRKNVNLGAYGNRLLISDGFAYKLKDVGLYLIFEIL